jgi:hypothetical protein
MVATKTGRGGKRKNAGRRLKYGEKTVIVCSKVPVSKVTTFKKYTKKWLDAYVV